MCRKPKSNNQKVKKKKINEKSKFIFEYNPLKITSRKCFVSAYFLRRLLYKIK